MNILNPRTTKSTLTALVIASVMGGPLAQAQQTGNTDLAKLMVEVDKKAAAIETQPATLTLELLKQLRAESPDENIVLSGTSLTNAMTLIAAGTTDTPAAGQSTSDQRTILKALGYNEAPMYSVLKDIAKFEMGMGTSPDFTIASKNAVYTSAPLDVEYKTNIEASHDAENSVVTFSNASTAEKINGWAKKATNDLIPSIVDRGEISDLDFLAINATYLDAKWSVEFDSPGRRGKQFYGTNGEVLKSATGEPLMVPMMMSNPSMAVAVVERPAFKAYDIPYKGGTGSFIAIVPKIRNEQQVKEAARRGDVVMPDMVSLEEAMNAVTPAELQSIISEIELQRSKKAVGEILLYMPKFKVEFEAKNDSLKGIMTNLGAGSIFERLDMSKMVQESHKGLWAKSKISLIKQKAVIEVGESGTKAAAVSAVGGFAMSCPPPSHYIDRPFAYIVRHAKSQKIVFAGTYVDPVKAGSVK